MFRYLPGLIAVQLVTIGLFVVGAGRREDATLVVSLLAFGIAVAVITAAWFAGIGRHAGERETARLEKRHLGEREKLRVDAERAKARIRTEQQKRLDRERRRIGARANRKVALGLAGVAIAGGVMLFTQFLTLGLIFVAGAAGFTGGYVARLRQERRRGATDIDAVLPRPRDPGP